MREGVNWVGEKSIAFSFRIINLYKFLIGKREMILSKQILRSGTSIGANISESVFAESNMDFIHKLSISRKEANETKYWLLLLQKGEYISEIEFNSMLQDCVELIKILTSIIISSKKKALTKS